MNPTHNKDSLFSMIYFMDFYSGKRLLSNIARLREAQSLLCVG